MESKNTSTWCLVFAALMQTGDKLKLFVQEPLHVLFLSIENKYIYQSKTAQLL